MSLSTEPSVLCRVEFDTLWSNVPIQSLPGERERQAVFLLPSCWPMDTAWWPCLWLVAGALEVTKG